jgi:hypothetical protein
MPNSQYDAFTGINLPRTKREPYKKRPVDERGRVGKEPSAVKSFWADYNMDQVMAMTPEELDIAIDKSLEDFAARQLKANKKWDWPVSPKDNFQKLRNKRIPNSKFN